MSAESERRGGARITRPIMVRYRRPGETAWHQGPLKDLSRTGARLMSDLPVDEGQPLELWIGLPLFVEPVQIVASVMRSKDAFSGSMALTELGISFERLSGAVQKTIDDAVQRFLKLQTDHE